MKKWIRLISASLAIACMSNLFPCAMAESAQHIALMDDRYETSAQTVQITVSGEAVHRKIRYFRRQ